MFPDATLLTRFPRRSYAGAESGIELNWLSIIAAALLPAELSVCSVIPVESQLCRELRVGLCVSEWNRVLLIDRLGLIPPAHLMAQDFSQKSPVLIWLVHITIPFDWIAAVMVP